MSTQDWIIDENYIPTLAIKVLEGRNFSLQFPTDSTAVIINEAAANFLGENGKLNKTLYTFKDMQTKEVIGYHIIGIVKNFNFSSLRDVVTPLAFQFGRNNGNISVRIHSSDIPGVLAQIKTRWKSVAPLQPFDYSFMDEDFNRLYTTEQRTGQIFVTFAVFAIIIACLGRFGLVTYAAEQRKKEIGVRKVLGADTSTIVAMIAKDFLKLVIIA